MSNPFAESFESWLASVYHRAPPSDEQRLQLECAFYAGGAAGGSLNSVIVLKAIREHMAQHNAAIVAALVIDKAKK